MLSIVCIVIFMLSRTFKLGYCLMMIYNWKFPAKLQGRDLIYLIMTKYSVFKNKEIKRCTLSTYLMFIVVTGLFDTWHVYKTIVAPLKHSWYHLLRFMMIKICFHHIVFTYLTFTQSFRVRIYTDNL